MAKGDDIQECGELCKIMRASAEDSSKAPVIRVLRLRSTSFEERPGGLEGY